MRKNYAGIDYFRVAAALMVIGIHIGPFSVWSEDLDYLLTYCIGRIAVPFFLMTTGYFVLAPDVRCSVSKCKTGMIVSFAGMLVEGFITYSLNLQKHNSMYLLLLPVMYFLFQLLLIIPGKAPEWIRNGSMLLYIIHPAVIVVLRGIAKIIGLTKLLIENTVVEYLAVCTLSFVFMLIIQFCLERGKQYVSKRTSLD